MASSNLAALQQLAVHSVRPGVRVARLVFFRPKFEDLLFYNLNVFLFFCKFFIVNLVLLVIFLGPKCRCRLQKCKIWQMVSPGQKKSGNPAGRGVFPSDRSCKYLPAINTEQTPETTKPLASISLTLASLNCDGRPVFSAIKFYKVVCSSAEYSD